MIANRPGFVTALGVGSNKIIAVPTNEYWTLLGVYIKLVASATVGTRQIRIQIRDASGNVLVELEAGETQVASATKNYAAAPGLVTEVHIAGEMLFMQLPRMRLVEAFDIRAFDETDVDDAADVLDLQINRIVDSEY